MRCGIFWECSISIPDLGRKIEKRLRQQTGKERKVLLSRRNPMFFLELHGVKQGFMEPLLW